MIFETTPDSPARAGLEVTERKQIKDTNHRVRNEIKVFISGMDWVLNPSIRYSFTAPAMMAARWLMAPQTQSPP